MRIAGLIAALVLAGCAASGVKVTDEHIASLKAGESTESQVVAQLGAPTMRMRLSDGTSIMVYSYSEVQVRPSTFIPIVGAFAGGSDMRSNTVTLRFDRDGKLIDTTSSQTNYGTGTGLAAGAVSQEPTQQPRQ